MTDPLHSDSEGMGPYSDVVSFDSAKRRRGSGICAMRGTCGKKGIFGQALPCPDDGDADEYDEETRSLLASVCGPSWHLPPRICCTTEQILTLRSSLQQAEPLIASCPACRNNFRSHFCSFTCSPDQSTFLDVTATQVTDKGEEAVKEVQYYVDEKFKQGFFESCRNVQFGATNGYAMDLIGGGAKNSSSFLKYMGDYRPGLGSPFQISVPETTHDAPSWPEWITPLKTHPLDCSDNTLEARCTCVDCPTVCATLPYRAPPRSPNQPTCTVGAVSCLTFSLLIIYSAGILFGLCVWSWKLGLRQRQKKYEKLSLLGEPPLSPSGINNGETNQFSHHMSNTTSQPESPSPHSAQDPFQITSITSNNSHRPQSHPRSVEPMGSFPDPDSSSGNPSGSSRYRLGRGASLLDPMEGLQPRQNRVNVLLRGWFYRLGWWCASKPALTFAITAVIVALLNIGWKFFAIETDPVRLWVSPNSEAAAQKAYFDETFGPFYRPQQVFVMGMPKKYRDEFIRERVDGQAELTIAKAGELPPPTRVLSYDTLDWWLKHEEEINTLKSEPNGYTLQDVCFAPAGPGSACVVQSVSAWFGTDMSEWDEDAYMPWQERLEQCAGTPSECLPDFGQPIEAKFVLGGFDSLEDYTSAKSLVITWVVNDSLDPEVKAKAEEWERTLESYLHDLEASAPAEAGVKLAYSTGVSLQEELNKSTNTDAKIVILSYLVMFLYVSLTLGGGVSSDILFGPDGVLMGIWDLLCRIPVLLHLKLAPEQSSAESFTSPSRKRRYLASLLPTLLSVNSKFLLGLFGILIVLVAVSSSVGLFSFLGVRVTLIIAEVIPFLVLAVGVDNVFILVHELERQTSISGPGAAAMQDRSGPGAYQDSLEEDLPAPMHLSPEERVARALARMGPSILLSSTTEVVAFALGALVPMPAVRNFALYAAGSVLLGAMLQCTVFISAMCLDLKRTEATRVDCFPCIRLQPPIGLYDVAPTTSNEGVVERFIRKHYAPFLLRKIVKQLVIVAFGGIFVTSIVGMQRITMGLDQRLALPSDSYLVDYFNALDAYLEIGPPVYFVAQDVDVTRRSGQQQLCGRFTTCMELSVVNTLEAERKRPDSSFLANAPAPWIDDFLHWTDPVLETCCRVRKADPSVFCSPRDSERLCRPCFADKDPAWDITMQGLPEGADVMRYLQQWLTSPTDEDCPLGGQAAYGSAVAIHADNTSVKASHFRTFHTPLKGQDDFINALAAAKRIAKDIHQRTGVKVYPYSLFYVFFEQYASIVSTTAQVLLLALAAIMGITTLLLGSWRTGASVTGVCLLSVFGVMGIMGFWHVSLNAISLVNLVIALGISVEFCSHLARAFMGAVQTSPVDGPVRDQEKERDERAYTALVDVGPSVFSGITMTKLIGISVLALTRSKLLEVYYFRMWLSLIVSGALHGLVLLPVVLTYTGGNGYLLEETDEDWVTSAMRRPDQYEYAPFHESEGDMSD